MTEEIRVKRVLDAAERLTLKERLSVGLNDGMLQKARAALSLEPQPTDTGQNAPSVPDQFSAGGEREYRVNAYDGIIGPFADPESALHELGEHQHGWEENGMGTRAPDLESRAVGPWEEGRFGTGENRQAGGDLAERLRGEIEFLLDSATAAEGVAASDVELEENPITGARANRRTADRLEALLDAQPVEEDCDDLCARDHERFAHMVNETEPGPCAEKDCGCKGFTDPPQPVEGTTLCGHCRRYLPPQEEGGDGPVGTGLYRCPLHGRIDGHHYSKEQEWSPEDGCPLLTSDEEQCGEEVEPATLTAAPSEEGGVGEAAELWDTIEYAEGQLRGGVAIGKVPAENVSRAHARLEALIEERGAVTTRPVAGAAVEAVARRRHEAEHEAHFDDLRWDQLPTERREIARTEARRDLEVAAATPRPGLSEQGLTDARETFRQIDLVVDAALHPEPAQEPGTYLRKIRELTYDFTRRTRPAPTQHEQPRCGGSGRVLRPPGEPAGPGAQDVARTSFKPCPGCPDCQVSEHVGAAGHDFKVPSHPSVLSSEEATAIVSAAHGEDHDAATLDAVLKRPGDWIDREVGAVSEHVGEPDYPDEIFIVTTGPELDELSPGWLTRADLSRYADVPVRRYVPVALAEARASEERAELIEALDLVSQSTNDPKVLLHVRPLLAKYRPAPSGGEQS